MKKTNRRQFKKKRSDTLIRTVEKQYGVDFGVRSDMKLGNYLKEQGLPSMGKALGKIEKRKNKKK